MSDMLTVSEVTRTLSVSTRMLRHYEKLGLLSSERMDGYAYRVYREEDIRRLRAILVLRKLRVPLKEIGEILDDPTPSAAIGVFEKNLSELDEEIENLSAVRGVIAEFLDALRLRRSLSAGDTLLEDRRLISLAESLSPASTQIQEERRKIMEKTEKALADVRIVHLPESEVAAAHVTGEDPEERAGAMIADFVRSERLWEKHPGLRLYGFNHPSPVDESGWHGYEFWVTVPDGFDVPPPLEKKRFPGGTYAAHMIRMGNFEEWSLFEDWVMKSEEYEYAGDGNPENMFDSLEEHLNYHDRIRETDGGEPLTNQLDLLIPVRRRTK